MDSLPNSRISALADHRTAAAGLVADAEPDETVSSGGIFTTFIDKDRYLAGLLVLASSLRQQGSKYELRPMLTAGVTESARAAIIAYGLRPIDIEVITLADSQLVDLPESFSRFRSTWTKLRAFALTEYDRVVFLDSDMVVVQSMDELFDIDLPPGHIAACHTCMCRTLNQPYLDGWTKEMCGLSRYVKTDDGKPAQPRPITFYALPGERLLNSGMLVIRPSLKTAKLLLDCIEHDPLVRTLKTVEQDLLAHVFAFSWIPLHWKYNTLRRSAYAAPYQYLTRAVFTGQDHQEIFDMKLAKNLHYILSTKPWDVLPQVGAEFEFGDRIWWAQYDRLKSEYSGEPQHWSTIESSVPALATMHGRAA